MYFYKKQTMYLPIRCFTCNKTLGHLAAEIENLRQNNTFPPNPDFFKTYGIKRYCCKTILLSNVDAFDKFSTKRDTSFYEVKNHLEIPRIMSTD